MKILIASNNKDHIAALDHLMEHQKAQGAEVVSVVGELAEFTTELVRQVPQVVILDGICTAVAELHALEEVLHMQRDTAVLLVSPVQTSEFLLTAMRSGIAEVLPAPPTGADLNAAIDRIRRRQPRTMSEKKRGRVIAFVPCKGGSGATFLAANLAHALSNGENSRVALLDFNLPFGDAALFVLSSRPDTTVADLAREINRLDGTFLESSMHMVSKGFWVLPAPETAEAAVGILPEHIDRIIDAAASNYDFVVVDVGRTLNALSIRALDNAEVIYMVLQMTLPFVRNAKVLLNTFAALGYGHEKVKLVVNRYQKKAGDLGLADVERALGESVSWTVPNSFEAVTSSVNQGVPVLRLAPRDAVSKTIREMADSYRPKEKPVAGGFWRALVRA